MAHQPYVEADGYTTARIANVLARLADARLAPPVTARLALSLCGPSIVEAVLACDPDAVLLDVSWARYLKPLLDGDFPGRVYITGGDHLPARAAATPPMPPEPSSGLVSIVLPTHNGRRFLRQSIQSCLDQTYRNLELIVVDDGSTEDIGSIVAEFTDERVRYVRHVKNQGLPAALNTGFRAAAGAYLTWTSDDNYYAPTAIERLTRFLQRHPAIPFVYTSVYVVDESAGAAPKIRRALPPGDLKRQNGVGASFLYTRQVYEEIGDYDAGAILVEDYDYWIRVSKKFRMQRILEPLYYYRYHEQSLTSKHTREDVARRFELVRQQNGISAAP